MIALQGHSPASLVRALPELTLGEARKIVSAVHRNLFAPDLFGTGTLNADGHRFGMPGVRRASMDAVVRSCSIPALRVTARHASAVDPFVKYALSTIDDHAIETVRIPLEHQERFSVCVSSQVGCALACAFCATGRMGLSRNLETWEIVDQVRIVRGDLTQGRVHGVVFQGMGEPMANLDRVLEAIAVLCDPSAMAIDARNITVCTSGLPTGIRRLAREAPNVRLALSIGSARIDVRRRLMPIDKAHPLAEVIDAAIEHATLTGLAPMWAVTPLKDVNDSDDDARALAALAQDFTARSGHRPRISVIPYNAIASVDDPFARTNDTREAGFRDAMRDAGVFSHKRYSGGGDVNAACGQLANKSAR
jgi:23S rRNA (adenine2503-C2)-methyltransferase